jgi:hypothetical protein
LPNQSAEVNRFMEGLAHPRKEEIELVRTTILGSNEAITEQIKWNAPSFCFNGDDRVTFRLHPGDRVELIFHRGPKVKESKDFAFEDTTGLLKWVAKDRAVVAFQDVEDVEAKRTALAEVVDQWMKSTTS